MEITFNGFENLNTSVLSEDQHLNFAMQTYNSPGGDDDDDDDDSSAAPADDNPPVDDDVVHSPLQPQPGKPKKY